MRYKNKRILLASKHQKEQAIYPVVHEMLGATLDVSSLDTDQFGTFTGEIPRPLTPYETCILKAKTAANETGHRFSMANEGSFGPHPSNPFVASGHEIMVFVDSDNGWIVSEQLVTEKTNYTTMLIYPETTIDNVLDAALFPSHGLTLQSGDRSVVIAKGITTHRQLEDAMASGFQDHSSLFLSTDMRAMVNPTRMASIRELATKLVKRIMTPCPDCGLPGFGFKYHSGSLPCEACGAASNMYAFENFACIECAYLEKKPRQDGLKKSDPTYCNDCNP